MCGISEPLFGQVIKRKCCIPAAIAMLILDKVQRERAFSIATNVDSHLKERTLEVRSNEVLCPV